MPFDAQKYLTYLDQERRRAVIVHAEPEKGAAMTQFARKLCVRSGGKYIDLLDWFLQHQEVSAEIDSFSPEKFRVFLIEQSKGFGLLLVDRADFVLDTWRRTERRDFFNMITDQWDGYKDGTRAKLLIALQTSQEIEALSILDSQGQSRVLRLSDFNDIL